MKWRVMLVFISLLVISCGDSGNSSDTQRRQNSGLTAKELKEEVKEIDGKIKALEVDISTLKRQSTQLNNKIDNLPTSGSGSSTFILFSIIGFLALAFILVFRNRENKRFRKQFSQLRQTITSFFGGERENRWKSSTNGNSEDKTGPTSQDQSNQKEGGTNQNNGLNKKPAQKNTSPANKLNNPSRTNPNNPSPLANNSNIISPGGSTYSENIGRHTTRLPKYAASPVNGFFPPNRIEEEQSQFTYYVIHPDNNGEEASFDLVEDATLQRQILDSQASHAEAIDFIGMGISGSSVQLLKVTPGLLKKNIKGWIISKRITVTLR